MSDRLRLYGQLALSFSVSLLAAAIMYFTYAMLLVVKEVPTLATQAQAASDSVKLAAEQLANVTEVIPGILLEVGLVREQIPLVLREVGLIRQQLPPVLAEVKAAREAIPPVLKTLDQYALLIPEVVTEVQNTREAIPSMLDRAEALVVNIDSVGKKASEEAAAGFIKGIFKAPFKLVADFRSSLFKGKTVSEEDKVMMVETSLQLLKTGNIGDSIPFKSDTSPLTGRIDIVADKTVGKKQCREIRIVVNTLGESKHTVCVNKNNEWGLVE